MPIKTNLTDLKPARLKFSRQIELLSKGCASPASFPDGQITVYPWDSTVDDFVANKISRKAAGSRGRNILFNILPKVCNLNGCPPEQFLSREVLLVLMVSRSILRNDEVAFDAVCPECGHTTQEHLKIPDGLERLGEKPAGYPGWDIITLHDSKDTVKVRPLRIADELAVMDQSDQLKKRIPEHVRQLFTALLEVGGGAPDGPDEALRWFEAISPNDSAYLLEQFEQSQPQLSTKVAHVCDECGKEFDRALTLDEDFFRRDGVQRDRGAVEKPVSPSVQVTGNNAGNIEATRVVDTKPDQMAQRTHRRGEPRS